MCPNLQANFRISVMPAPVLSAAYDDRVWTVSNTYVPSVCMSVPCVCLQAMPVLRSVPALLVLTNRDEPDKFCTVQLLDEGLKGYQEECVNTQVKENSGVVLTINWVSTYTSYTE